MKSSKLKLVAQRAFPVPESLIQALIDQRLRLRPAMHLALLSISTILLLAGHQHLYAQQVTSEEHPAQTTQPSLPDLDSIPRASAIPTAPSNRAVLESDMPQSKHGDVYNAAGDVVLTYNDHVLRADSMTYNSATGDVTAEGHVHLSGGENNESIAASHATYNLRTATGRFYDVTGSVGMRPGSGRNGYVTDNPFLFSGRLVVKTGPQNYDIYDGSVTSCLLLNPDWQLFGSHFSLDGDKARASSSTFRLLGVPVLFLPYVTHPVETDQRQSGILIPVVSYTPTSKGLVLGEDVYFVLGRSADLTIGTIYYSLRGFSESGTFRYRGVGNNFFSGHFSALQDRGYTPAGGVYTNQGGQDVTVAFRREFNATARFVGDAEYLSSYPYREAFTDTFNQAVSSDITSVAYMTRQWNGYSLDGRVDRYQGLKQVPVGTTDGEEVRIFHAPSIDFTALDHPISGTPLLWSLTSSAAGLKRSEPDFTSSGIIERLDFRPELALPLSGGGWHTMSTVAARETFYSRSQTPISTPGVAPVELTQTINRSNVDVKIDIRPPAIERTFQVPEPFQKLFGSEARHTIEPELTYNYVAGINNFLGVLRFDDIDLASNTNQLEYGVTQHVYFRPRHPAKPFIPKPGCPVPTAREISDALHPTPHATTDANGIPDASNYTPDQPIRTHARHPDPCALPTTAPRQEEWFSWKLAQQYFFDPYFGGAVVDGRRNIFDSTLSLSGIAFLTEARNISPVISRMRFRTSEHTDIEWDFDLDTGASKFTSSNIFLDAHEGPLVGGFSFARLNAPGRFYTVNLTNNTLVGSSVSDFSQMRLLLGYGTPTKPGLSVAGNAGIDLNAGSLQYAAVQTTYNWNCCGVSVEYRKFDLGTVRNDNTYRFNFTLANIGTAGNLRRREQLF